MIKKLSIATRIEILKYKRTYALALATLAPLLIAGIMGIIYLVKATQLVKPGDNGIAEMLQGSLSFASVLLFPHYLILLTILVHQIEHRSQSLKDLFSYPIPYFATYTSKWVVSLLLIALSLLLFLLFSLISIGVLNMVHPDLFWFDKGLVTHFAKGVGIVALSSLFMMGLQFLISLRWNNAIVAFGVGIVGYISAIILSNGWKFIHLHPYASSFLSFQSMSENWSGKEASFFIAFNLIGMICLFVIGYFGWSKRLIK